MFSILHKGNERHSTAIDDAGEQNNPEEVKREKEARTAEIDEKILKARGNPMPEDTSILTAVYYSRPELLRNALAQGADIFWEKKYPYGELEITYTIFIAALRQVKAWQGAFDEMPDNQKYLTSLRNAKECLELLLAVANKEVLERTRAYLDSHLPDGDCSRFLDTLINKLAGHYNLTNHFKPWFYDHDSETTDLKKLLIERVLKPVKKTLNSIEIDSNKEVQVLTFKQTNFQKQCLQMEEDALKRMYFPNYEELVRFPLILAAYKNSCELIEYLFSTGTEDTDLFLICHHKLFKNVTAFSITLDHLNSKAYGLKTIENANKCLESLIKIAQNVLLNKILNYHPREGDMDPSAYLLSLIERLADVRLSNSKELKELLVERVLKPVESRWLTQQLLIFCMPSHRRKVPVEASASAPASASMDEQNPSMPKKPIQAEDTGPLLQSPLVMMFNHKLYHKALVGVVGDYLKEPMCVPSEKPDRAEKLGSL